MDIGELDEPSVRRIAELMEQNESQLREQRERSRKAKEEWQLTREVYRLLYGGYEKQREWWEVVELIRKVCCACLPLPSCLLSLRPARSRHVSILPCSSSCPQC